MSGGDKMPRNELIKCSFVYMSRREDKCRPNMTQYLPVAHDGHGQHFQGPQLFLANQNLVPISDQPHMIFIELEAFCH